MVDQRDRTVCCDGNVRNVRQSFDFLKMKNPPKTGKCVLCGADLEIKPRLIDHYKIVHGLDYSVDGKEKKILVQFPTRNRKEKFLNTLKLYYGLAEDLDRMFFNVVIDSDDAEMQSADLSGFRNLKKSPGVHGSKVAAINDFSGVNVSEFDIILLASDDMIPKIKGYDRIIRNRMKEYFPDNSGVLWFFDGYRRDLNTLSILGVNYFKLFNYIYNPEYKSLFCDDEFTSIAALSGMQVFIDECIIKHEHQVWTGEAKDQLYAKNDSFFNEDKATFERRKNNNFFFKENKDVILEVLICTIEGRENLFNSVYSNLLKQVSKFKLERKIKISFLKDNKQMTIGEKRNKLLDASVGKYVCFVDDDDEISENYIELIYNNLLKNPDCIGIVGVVYLGNNTKYFIHSNRYNKYYERDGIYYRPPNHLNPIKSDFARRVRFNDKSVGEDTEWAVEVCARRYLRNEILITEPIYFYNAE